MKPPNACYYLENKAYFFPPLGRKSDEEPEPLSTPFTCLKTHEQIGPDGEEACDELCGRHRTCYRPEVEL